MTEAQPRTPELALYGTRGCHLCDTARNLLVAVLPQGRVLEVEIGYDVALVERYGEHIPVLRRMDSGAELKWPFDAAALQNFLATQPGRG